MRGIFLLAWRYLSFYRVRSSILILCIALVAFLPIALNGLIASFQERMTARARSTPLVVGSPGSRYDLLLHALYFEGGVENRLSMADVEPLSRGGLGTPIPLFCAHTARGRPVVGTTPEYYVFRGLRPASGTLPLLLGDAVLGAEAAQALGLGAGDAIITDQRKLHDIGATYPLKMHISGVLAPTGTADDRAIFCDLKTAWVIEGIGHGHKQVDPEKDRNLVLEEGRGNVAVNAAILEYNEITDRNRGSFHFHADAAGLPITACLVLPGNEKAATLLKARLRARKGVQPMLPEKTLDELMGIVFKVKRFFDLNLAFVGLATVLFLSLVVLLTIRLRAGEIRTLARIGCSRAMVWKLQACELAIVLSSGLLLAALFSAILMRGLSGVSIFFH